MAAERRGVGVVAGVPHRRVSFSGGGRASSNELA
jgi:hypothetical protein